MGIGGEKSSSVAVTNRAQSADRIVLSRAIFRSGRDAILADQGRQAKFAERERSEPLARRLVSQIPRPAPSSPMQ